MTIESFWRAVATYRARYHGSITSGGRTPARNAHVGGVPHSAHLVDLAADLVCELPADWQSRVAYGVTLGLRVIVEGDHDHLQPLDWSPEAP